LKITDAKIPLRWRGGFDQREKTGWFSIIDHPRNLKFTISNFSPPLEGNFFSNHYDIFFKLNIFKTLKIETSL